MEIGWLVESDYSPFVSLLHFLLPDGSVMIAGSNPNVDVNLTATFPTAYEVEYFYPPYYQSNRSVPTDIPQTLSYGGKYFDINPTLVPPTLLPAKP